MLEKSAVKMAGGSTAGSVGIGGWWLPGPRAYGWVAARVAARASGAALTSTFVPPRPPAANVALYVGGMPACPSVLRDVPRHNRHSILEMC